MLTDYGFSDAEIADLRATARDLVSRPDRESATPVARISVTAVVVASRRVDRLVALSLHGCRDRGPRHVAATMAQHAGCSRWSSSRWPSRSSAIIAAGALWLIFGAGRYVRTTHLVLVRIIGCNGGTPPRSWPPRGRRAGCASRSKTNPPPSRGNAIVIGRHTSIGDALIPALLFAGRLRPQHPLRAQGRSLVGPARSTSSATGCAIISSIGHRTTA